ncbi:hypothetical protein BOTU111922_26505 [Bordetella tumulicola]
MRARHAVRTPHAGARASNTASTADRLGVDAVGEYALRLNGAAQVAILIDDDGSPGPACAAVASFRHTHRQITAERVGSVRAHAASAANALRHNTRGAITDGLDNAVVLQIDRDGTAGAAAAAGAAHSKVI